MGTYTTAKPYNKKNLVFLHAKGDNSNFPLKLGIDKNFKVTKILYQIAFTK